MKKNLYVVDTNVPIVANRATDKGKKDGGALLSDIPMSCISGCVDIIDKVTRERLLVIDESGEIFDEYKKRLSFTGQPGVGDKFLKWVHDHQWSLPKKQRVRITKIRESYAEFPEHTGLEDFDLSDRKFVAVANAHSEKPVIVQASDSKWYGWKNALAECGIEVEFVCTEYIKRKFNEKMVK